MPYIESYDEFQARMNCPFVTTGGRYLFANGAQSNGTDHLEPPADPLELLPLEIEYLAARLKTEERQFNECKRYIITQAQYYALNAGPAPAEEAFTDLERFQKNVLATREEIEDKQTTLARLRGPSREQIYHEQRGQQRATAQDAIDRAMSLGI